MSFLPAFDGIIYFITARESGVLVSGRFDTINASPCKGIAGLRDNGTRDTAFEACSVDWKAINLLPLRDGRFLLGGNFSRVAGSLRDNLARLDANGRLTPTFSPSTFGSVLALAELADGNFLIAGEFMEVSGFLRAGFARLHANGSLDLDFDARLDGHVQTVVVQPDGRILIGGDFTTVGECRDKVLLAC
jgi:hypothetical protein